MSSTVPTKVSEYVLWLANFNTVAGNNQAQLGLSASDMTALTASATTVNTLLAALDAAIGATKAAHVKKTQGVRASETLLRGYAKRIQANPAVSDALKKQLGVNVRKPASHTPPTAPVSLNVVGQDNGINNLSWKPNGNTQSTVYFIETMIGNAPTWTLLDGTTRTKYAVSGTTPGIKTLYRVRAKRNEQVSAYSNTVVVYGP